MTTREIAEYVHTLDAMEYKTFLNGKYGIKASNFKNIAIFLNLNLRHKMYEISFDMIMKGEY